jgi:hypothetical protein
MTEFYIGLIILGIISFFYYKLVNLFLDQKQKLRTRETINNYKLNGLLDIDFSIEKNGNKFGSINKKINCNYTMINIPCFKFTDDSGNEYNIKINTKLNLENDHLNTIKFMVDDNAFIKK